MALTPEDQARLSSLLVARDAILTGARVGRFRDSDGVEVSYADMSDLDKRRLYAEIDRLQLLASGQRARGPARAMW